jgi:hypothetical protein
MQTGQKYTGHFADLVGDHCALLQLEHFGLDRAWLDLG